MKSTFKLFIAGVGLLIYIFSYTTLTLMAAPAFVDECLENPEECEEPAEEPVTETDETENDILGQETESSSLFFEIIRVFFALLLVLALIYIFLYFLKRRNKLGNRIKSLQNIGGITVGQNKSVQLIRLDNRLYLIGVGEDINLLQEIKDQDLINQLMTEMEEEATELSMDTVLSVFKKKKTNKDSSEDNFKNLFNQELDSIQRKRKNIINKHKEDHNE